MRNNHKYKHKVRKRTEVVQECIAAQYNRLEQASNAARGNIVIYHSNPTGEEEKSSAKAMSSQIIGSNKKKVVILQKHHNLNSHHGRHHKKELDAFICMPLTIE